MRGLNAFQLKLLMALLMVLDHVRHIQGLVPPVLGAVFIVVSRCVAPVFAYLVVEGVLHTGDLRRYCARLFLFAGITLGGNTALNLLFDSLAASMTEVERQGLHMHNNILITLALAALGFALVQWGREEQKRGLFALAPICFIAGLFFEWGITVVPFMLAVYFFRDNKRLRYGIYAVTELATFLTPRGEPLWLLGLAIIPLYNGERGPKTALSKYFFYLFYPVHLWVIAVINLAVTLH
jgi:hypothetical protein